jgi:hypothetical protein
MKFSPALLLILRNIVFPLLDEKFGSCKLQKNKGRPWAACI